MQAKLLSIKGETSWRHFTLDEGKFNKFNLTSRSQGSCIPRRGVRLPHKYSKRYLLRRSQICYTARFINFVAMVVRSVFSCGISNVGLNAPALLILKEI